MKQRYAWLIQGLTLVVWSCAVVGYFGPWVGHPSAALAWNAYDLFDLLQRLPHIEHGTLRVNLQALHMPLIGLGLLLPLTLLYPHRREATVPRGLIKAASVYFWEQVIFVLLGATLSLITLPPYPEIMNAWRTPGWQRLAFWWGIVGIISAPLAGWLASRLGRYRPWVNMAGLALTSLPALVTFQRVLPALAELHATRIKPGWGFWLYAISALALALCFCVQGLKRPKTHVLPHKERK